jgi:hypothetical protein
VRGKQREGCWREFEARVAYLVHAAKPAVLGRERHASRIVATVWRTTQGGHQPGRHGIIARLDGIRDNEFTGRCADLHLGACVRDTPDGGRGRRRSRGNSEETRGTEEFENLLNVNDARQNGNSSHEFCERDLT